MIETNKHTDHVAAIIPVAGAKLEYNMPWHECLMPVSDNYHAIEYAVHSAALAGVNTIWIVLHRDTQPLIKKKVGEWIYDPETVWVKPRPFWNIKHIPIYYVAINSRDRNRKDSNAWSCLYGAKMASYVSKKISKWVLPKKFLVIPPYGITNSSIFTESRQLIRSNNNILFTSNETSFLDNNYLPFTFDQEVYQKCHKHFLQTYTSEDTRRTYSDIFSATDVTTYKKVDVGWHYAIDTWNNYRTFIGSKHNLTCVRPKYLVTHKWYGLVNDK